MQTQKCDVEISQLSHVETSQVTFMYICVYKAMAILLHCTAGASSVAVEFRVAVEFSCKAPLGHNRA